MKRSAIVLGVIIISVFVTFAGANAETVSFGDMSKYWPGWGNGSSDDSKDVVGVPNFIGGQATITDGLLTNLEFNRAVVQSYVPLMASYE